MAIPAFLRKTEFSVVVFTVKYCSTDLFKFVRPWLPRKTTLNNDDLHLSDGPISKIQKATPNFLWRPLST